MPASRIQCGRESDEKRIIAAEAAADTKLARLIQKEIALRDASFFGDGKE